MLERNTLQPAWECGICWDKYDSADVKCTLKCGHAFDRKCLIAWLDRSMNCPMCFLSLSEEEIHQFVSIKQRVIWGVEAVNRVFISKEHLFMLAALMMFWMVNSLSSLLTRETVAIVNAKQADLISSFAGRQVIYVLSGFFSGAGLRGARCGDVAFFSAGLILGMVLLWPLFSAFDGHVSNYTFIGLPLVFMAALALGRNVANEKLRAANTD